MRMIHIRMITDPRSVSPPFLTLTLGTPYAVSTVPVQRTAAVTVVVFVVLVNFGVLFDPINNHLIVLIVETFVSFIVVLLLLHGASAPRDSGRTTVVKRIPKIVRKVEKHHVARLDLRHLEVGFRGGGGNDGRDDRVLVPNVDHSLHAKRLGIHVTWIGRKIRVHELAISGALVVCDGCLRVESSADKPIWFSDRTLVVFFFFFAVAFFCSSVDQRA